MSETIDYKEFWKVKMQVDDLKKLAKSLGGPTFDHSEVQKKKIDSHKKQLVAMSKKVDALEKGGKRR